VGLFTLWARGNAPLVNPPLLRGKVQRGACVGGQKPIILILFAAVDIMLWGERDLRLSDGFCDKQGVLKYYLYSRRLAEADRAYNSSKMERVSSLDIIFFNLC